MIIIYKHLRIFNVILSFICLASTRSTPTTSSSSSSSPPPSSSLSSSSPPVISSSLLQAPTSTEHLLITDNTSQLQTHLDMTDTDILNTPHYVSYPPLTNLSSVNNFLNNFIHSESSYNDSENELLTFEDTIRSNNTFVSKCPPEGEISMRILGAFVSYVFLVVGTVGNLCVIAVVMKTKSLRRHPTNWYLASVALADFIILWSAAFPTILEYQTAVGEWVFGGRIGCSAAVFFQYLAINVSSIFITTFSLERYVAICHPMKAMVICTVSRAKKIVALVWLFGTIYCAPWLFLSTTVPLCGRSNSTAIASNISHHITTPYTASSTVETNLESSTRVRLECTFTLQRSHYTIYYMADFIIFYIIPLSSTCALYLLIARTIKFNRGVNNKSSIAPQHQPRWSKGLKYFTSRVQVVKMLSIVVAVFAISWFPYRMFVVYNSLARVRFISPWFLTFCRLAVFFNSTINPVLYNLMSAKFRKAFAQLFLCSRFTERSAHMRHLNIATTANPSTSHIL